MAKDLQNGKKEEEAPLSKVQTNERIRVICDEMKKELGTRINTLLNTSFKRLRNLENVCSTQKQQCSNGPEKADFS